ncbi:MAG: pentapeptide repeat-containing protein [Snowella sp.]|nr:pentapeptide repeat-containing protein [Snowella sp.]
MANLKSWRTKEFWFKERTVWKPGLFLLIAFLCVLIAQPILWPGGLGIGKDNSVTTTTVEKDKHNNIVKTTEITTYNDGKTLWDWQSILGVPLTLAILGYWLQQLQQKRAEEFAKEQQERAEKATNVQQEIAANENKEEVLQAYFDRISVLLIDKNLIAIATKIASNTATDEEKELLDSSKNIIRARTLSILRRFKDDADRKTSVIKFLIDSDIVRKLKLNLSKFNLSEAVLYKAALEEVNLELANLNKAYLSEAKLNGANLKWAYLEFANLKGANLEGANLEETNLKGANFPEVNLEFANLKGANLELADLANISWNSHTQWPDKNELAKAINIPDKLRKELGLDEEPKA